MAAPERDFREKSQREQQRTDTSASSIGGSLLSAMERNLRLEEILKRQANESPAACLKRLLTTQSAISTSSSFAERQQAAVGSAAPFREIGTGSIGKVFEQAGTPWAFKALLIDRTDKLWNNYVMHLRIQHSFDQLATNFLNEVEIPRVAWFANANSEYSLENLDLFPDSSTFPRKPREIMCMERIYPLPAPVRESLIDLFCAPERAEMAKNNKSNKDCLVRVLLGRRRYGSSRPGGSMFFSLRNYKLHIDQVESLELDADEYAIGMADALASLHWHKKIDGMDIEFVLGSTPLDQNAVRRNVPLSSIEELAPGTSTFENITNSSPNFKKRVVSLWMLDFDAFSPTQMDTSGVQKAIRAFLETEPACPKPNSDDKIANHLWTVFSERYIETGKKITAGTTFSSLPQRFIDGIQLALHKGGSTSQSESRSITASQQTPHSPTNPLRPAPGTFDESQDSGNSSRYGGSMRYGRGQYVMGNDQIRQRGALGGSRRNPLRGVRGTSRGPSR